MVNIPSNLQNTWNDVAKDGKLNKEDIDRLKKEAVNYDKHAAALTGKELNPEQKLELMTSELDTAETEFLNAIESNRKEGVDLQVKNGSAPGTFEFVDSPKAEVVNASAEQNGTEPQKSETANKVNNPGNEGEFDLPPVNHEPEQVPLLPIHQWSGYNSQINSSFSEIFSVNNNGKGIPVIAENKGKEIASSLGFNSIGALQNEIGANKDNKYGPETHTKTKAYLSNRINSENNVDNLQQLKGVVNNLAAKNGFGKDPDLAAMITRIDQKINNLSSSGVLKQFDTNVRSILSQTDPKNAESLAQAKTKLMEEFNKLPEAVRNTPQADLIFTSAMTKVFKATKAEIINTASSVSDVAINEALKSGDPAKLTEAKKATEGSVEKLDKLQKDPDFQKAKELLEKTNPNEVAMSPENVKAAINGKLEKAEGIIKSVNELINKPGWKDEERAAAAELLNQLPDGDFKQKLQKAIEGNTEKAQLLEKNKSNLNTAVAGLSDVIGNGFWNLENKSGTKAMFQLVAKQGLLDETLKKMNVDDQKEAIKMLTENVKNGKPEKGDDFNLAIAQRIYQNLSKSMNVDEDFDSKKLLPKLKETAPENFESFNIDQKSFVEGMKFSIGSGRAGSEQEAAVTMGRALINGEVSADCLTQFNKSELDTLVKFMGEKGSKEDKEALLKTIANTYNAAKPVQIEGLEKTDKAVIIKNVLENPARNDSKLDELVKTSGKDAIFEAVEKQNLSDKNLAILARHTDGDSMADEPKIAAKMMVAMIKTYNEQGKDGDITLEDIKKFIQEIDNDWWEDDDTMKLVIDLLGDGPESDYAKFQKLAPSTLDKIRNIAD